jgi:hypothetical protein
VKLGKVVGERVLTYGPKGRQRIIVRVGTPRRVDPRTWLCAFQIAGTRSSRVDAAYGVDALQARFRLLLKVYGFTSHVSGFARRGSAERRAIPVFHRWFRRSASSSPTGSPG